MQLTESRGRQGSLSRDNHRNCPAVGDFLSPVVSSASAWRAALAGSVTAPNALRRRSQSNSSPARSASLATSVSECHNACRPGTGTS